MIFLHGCDKEICYLPELDVYVAGVRSTTAQGAEQTAGEWLCTVSVSQSALLPRFLVFETSHVTQLVHQQEGKY